MGRDCRSGNRGGARGRPYPGRQATTKGQAIQEGPKGPQVQEGQEEGRQEEPKGPKGQEGQEVQEVPTTTTTRRQEVPKGPQGRQEVQEGQEEQEASKGPKVSKEPQVSKEPKGPTIPQVNIMFLMFDYDPSVVHSASYNSPWEIFGRRNEVMFMQMQHDDTNGSNDELNQEPDV